MLRKGCRSTLQAGESLSRHLLHLLHERGAQVCWQAWLRGEPWPRRHPKACGSGASNHTKTQSPILTLHASPVGMLDARKNFCKCDEYTCLALLRPPWKLP